MSKVLLTRLSELEAEQTMEEGTEQAVQEVEQVREGARQAALLDALGRGRSMLPRNLQSCGANFAYSVER